MTTRMRDELSEVPQVVARQLAEGLPLYREIGARLRAEETRLVITCARGTSDHAATWFKYLAEIWLGVPVASVGPSMGSIYGARLRLDRALCLTISQSGGSPDLVALQARARDGGAHAVALLNEIASPVAAGADAVAPLLAGPERAVAATKSYVAALVALSAIVAEWAGDAALAAGLDALPDQLARAIACDWSGAAGPLATARSVFTLSRGQTLAVALESALKFKETCRLHAEAYSAAEVRHGPIRLARREFAALVFATRDAGRASVMEAAGVMRAAGARVFLVDPGATGGADRLACPAARHPALDGILQAAAFYSFVEAMSVGLGENPDAPDGLAKVTETR